MDFQGPQCDFPQRFNSLAQLESTDLSLDILSIAWYKCDSIGPSRQSIICKYDKVKKKAFWDGIDKIMCLPQMRGCAPDPEFSFDKTIEMKKEYIEGESVKFRCPNGFIRKKTCTAITVYIETNRLITLYYWEPKDSKCSGIDFD